MRGLSTLQEQRIFATLGFRFARFSAVAASTGGDNAMLLNEIGKAYRYLRCVPKTVYFNLKYLPLRDALKFPILISHRVALRRMHGSVRIDQATLGRVKIGFRSNNVVDEGADLAVWDVTGTVEFTGRIEIGPAMKLLVSGHLSLGDNFWASGRSLISCVRRIEFGTDNLLSWDVTVIDHDFHAVSDSRTGEVINEPKPVSVGNHVWVCARATILRGTVVGDGTVVAANSLLNRAYEGQNQIVGGNPARVLRKNIRWVT